MTEQSIATFEGLLRRLPAFYELGEEQPIGLPHALDHFIAQLVRSFCVLIAFLSLFLHRGRSRQTPSRRSWFAETRHVGLFPARRSGRLGRLVRRSPWWLTAATFEIDRL